ncbi:hypothetical protein M3223_19490 [Paenibacillus pasadenensis]|uniref:hypothetical protein n=1 Tax=Paenibacillus pasadenensis TaxID=217090 RepID=UPI002041E049|nr:hypothetical protein [Paenibacillus pasadenensis]MCM3749540.1 hypothetical protein [Paenibacillus pasadenensis]
MNEHIHAYYERLHQAIGELLGRAGAYRSGEELEALQTEHARLNPQAGELQEGALMSLMGMRAKLVTMMENALYTI